MTAALVKITQSDRENTGESQKILLEIDKKQKKTGGDTDKTYNNKEYKIFIKGLDKYLTLNNNRDKI